MRILSIFAIISLLAFVKSGEDISNGAVDCTMGSSSCESCRAAYPFCYWCDGKCRQYFGRTIAKIECRGRVMYESCENQNKVDPNLEEIFGIVSALKNEHKKRPLFPPNEGNVNNNLFAEISNTSEKSKLKRLLKLLKMLVYIKELKKKNHSSLKSATTRPNYENELGKLGENAEMMEKSMQSLYSGSQKSSNSDLDALMKLVGQEQSSATPLHQRGNPKFKTVMSNQNSNGQINRKIATTVSEAPVVSPSKQIKITRWHTLSSKPAVTLRNVTMPKGVATSSGNYCELFEQEDECNGDKDCSWCNILDVCVGRNKEDFKHCIGDKRNEKMNMPISDESNFCAGRTSCASCTKKGKCYWCEKTKSCHIYPFFGFIPHNCPTNMWYYKECDVQLAIFIILFPLLMILLSMGVFYVCLRYCYYRRRTLKVQLFEKPEIFEKRKGKKVYFVGGDDDEEELRSELIRKKYNLPQEKEPLISP